jgi:hypothetical protein
LEKRNRILLPESVRVTLGLAENPRVGIVQRPNGVALKRVEIVKVEGDQARLVDVETRYEITRRAETNPMPEELVPRLRERSQALRLRYDLRHFLAGRETLLAWQARQLLSIATRTDEDLRERLILERLEGQGQDGSWEGEVILTARNLRELADLGMTAKDEPVQRAVAWLMARPQSPHNPGMFFAADELVAEQMGIVAQRGQGRGGRFRAIKTSEKKRVIAGDSLIQAPCGPRIMWPNALVLEPLLQLGYEDHQRVQAALHTMAYPHDWCECGYQHGLSSWRRADPPTMDEIEAFEQECIAQFRYGGLRDLEALERADLAHGAANLPRIAHVPTAEGDEYPLHMPNHIQGCEFITTRALGQVRDQKTRRFARAHLWRFASRQHDPNGAFPKERYGSGFGQAGILEALARYEHPASRVAILRSLPWIIEMQNQDGSWGQEGQEDASTLAIASALVYLGDDLPLGFIL